MDNKWRYGTMSSINGNCERFHVGRLLNLAAFAIFAAGSFTLVAAQQPGQKTFPSCERASDALFAAVQREDVPVLLQILGPAAKEIISSGDEEEDRKSQQQFVEKYQEMHRLASEPDGTTVLYIGAENWPTPIPLVKKGNRWYFDAVASKREILFRRIGRNELATIAVCRALVDAQKEYYAERHDGDPVMQYAPRFVSDDGKHNGLYWKISTGEPESPVGPLLTLASLEDYAKETDRPKPFHGYYYRILKGQGTHAPGGVKKYLFNGKMTGGFAFVAYPAEYRDSGVMTFIVSQGGIVYQKDLGPNTVSRARTLSLYDPDARWKMVQ
jgi:hypothetical protein